MGKIEEYKKKIIDNVDSFEGISGGISPSTPACKLYIRSSCSVPMFKTCSTCKYYKETFLKTKKIPICTASKY